MLAPFTVSFFITVKLALIFFNQTWSMRSVPAQTANKTYGQIHQYFTKQKPKKRGQFPHKQPNNFSSEYGSYLKSKLKTEKPTIPSTRRRVCMVPNRRTSSKNTDNHILRTKYNEASSAKPITPHEATIGARRSKIQKERHQKPFIDSTSTAKYWYWNQETGTAKGDSSSQNPKIAARTPISDTQQLAGRACQPKCILSHSKHKVSRKHESAPKHLISTAMTTYFRSRWAQIL